MKLINELLNIVENQNHDGSLEDETYDMTKNLHRVELKNEIRDYVIANHDKLNLELEDILSSNRLSFFVDVNYRAGSQLEVVITASGSDLSEFHPGDTYWTGGGSVPITADTPTERKLTFHLTLTDQKYTWNEEEIEKAIVDAENEITEVFSETKYWERNDWDQYSGNEDEDEDEDEK